MQGTTLHTVRFGDARDLAGVAPASVELVLTSPPYPMIAMWDDAFAAMNPAIGRALSRGDGPAAFELMHRELDAVWSRCAAALRPGGFLCVNVGDATRTVNGEFRLYPSHARIVQACLAAGLENLPGILWRKPTNAPTKFMGSGMLPAGAYVTLEHEHILVFRKGGRRAFAPEERERRKRSAIFWEERNAWFSDVWFDLRGTGQGLGLAGLRERSAAFPFELAYRLIAMFSIAGDTVLDPFLGTGTTMLAAMASARHSIGHEIDPAFLAAVTDTVHTAPEVSAARTAERLRAHRAFVRKRVRAGSPPGHRNSPHAVPVMSSQEAALALTAVESVEELAPGRWRTTHRTLGFGARRAT